MPSLGPASYPGTSRLFRYPPASYPYGMANGQDGYSCTEGLFEPYNYQAQSTSYVQGQEPQSSQSVYTAQDGGRQWAAATTQCNRPGSGAYDNTQPAIGYPGSATSTSVTASEAPVIFPGMNALATHLPTALMSERVLPTPRTGIVPSTTEALNGLSQGYYSDSGSLSSSQSTIFKPQLPWSNERLGNGGSQSIITNGASPTGILTSNAPKISSSPPSIETSHTYILLPANQTPPTASSTSSNDYSITPTTAAAGGLEDSILTSSAYVQNDSRESLRNQRLQSSTYPYSMSDKVPTSRDAALINEQRYTFLPRSGSQPSLQHYQSGRRDSVEGTGRSSLRMPVASISSALR